jgi:broad specificity phosphatase PhoE
MNSDSKNLLLFGSIAALTVVTAYCLKRVSDLERNVKDKDPKKEYHKPRSILLVRHGQSEGNIDERKYQTVGDVHIQLTEEGKQQASLAGEEIAAKVAGRKVFVYVSPYTRTRETAEIIKGQLQKAKIDVVLWREDPRIREREFCGTFQKENVPSDIQSGKSYSKFFFRPASGESCADVYDRMSSFIDTLWRDFKYFEAMEDNVVLIISHGLTSRLFLMRWLHWSVEILNNSRNPGNCAILSLSRQRSEHDGGKSDYYRLSETSCKQLGYDNQRAKEVMESSPASWVSTSRLRPNR